MRPRVRRSLVALALVGTGLIVPVAANACLVGTLSPPTLAASGIATLSATYNNQLGSSCGATARFTATWSGGTVTIHNAALSTSIGKAFLTVRTTLAASEVQARVGQSLTIGLQLGNYSTGSSRREQPGQGTRVTPSQIAKPLLHVEAELQTIGYA